METAYFNYPMLDRVHALPLVKRFSDLSLGNVAGDPDCRSNKAYPYQLAKVVAPEQHLLELRKGIKAVALDCGFPDTKGAKKSLFDQEVGNYLLENMHILPTEAADERVWNFLTLVVSPEVAKWRYPNTSNNPEFARWLGGPRNIFRKAWWRSYVLGPELNSKIGEDEGVGLMERPTFGGNPRVAKAIVRKHDELGVTSKHANSEVFRRVMVQLSRLAVLIDFRVLNDELLDQKLSQAFQIAVSKLDQEERNQKPAN